MLILILATASGNFCPSYSCGSNPYVSASGYCIYQEGSSYFLSVCDDDYYSYCHPVTSNMMCSLPPTHNDLNISYPGEPCVFDRNCMTSVCVNGRCVIESDTPECTENSMCNNGYFCNKTASVCTKLINPKTGANEQCIYDTDCDYNYGCNSEGYCVQYFSLGPGSAVSNCLLGINFLCKFGACRTDQDSGSYVCLENTNSSSSLPIKCVGDGDCLITSGNSSYTTGCECGYNPQAQSYCNLAPGDKPFVTLQQIYWKWLNSRNVTNCNTDRRTHPRCIQTYSNHQFFANYSYFYQLVYNYVSVQGNDQCIKQIYTNEYWQAYSVYSSYLKKSKKSSFGAYLLISGLYFLVN